MICRNIKSANAVSGTSVLLMQWLIVSILRFLSGIGSCCMWKTRVRECNRRGLNQGDAHILTFMKLFAEYD